MGKNVKVWIFTGSVSDQILKSQEMQDLVRQKCDEIAARAGDGFEVELKVGKNRCSGKVKATTRKAAGHNAKHNTLIKAINGVTCDTKKAERAGG